MMKEDLELAYLYVSEANGEDYNIDINFSQDKIYKYDYVDRTFSIEIVKDQIPKSFFGSNIKNVTAIIGKNGVGKSTLLNILRLSIDDQLHQLPHPKYFILYVNIKTDELYCEYWDLNPFINLYEKNLFLGLVSCHIENGKLVLEKTFKGNELPLKMVSFENQNIKKKSNYFPNEQVTRCLLKESHLVDIFDLLYQFQLCNTGLHQISFFSSKQRNLTVSVNNINFVRQELKNLRNRKGLLDPNMQNKVMRLDLIAKELLSTHQNSKNSLSAQVILYLAFSLAIYYLQHYAGDESWLQKKVLTTDESVQEVRDSMDEHSLKIDEIISHLLQSEDLSSLIEFIQSQLKFILDTRDGSLQNSIFLDSLNIFCELLDQINVESNHINDLLLCNISKEEEPLFRRILGYIDSYQEIIEVTKNSVNAPILNMMISFRFTGFSSGEMSLIKQFASLNTMLKAEKSIKNLVLVLDEYELHLHPEWSRRYLNNFLQYLQSYSDRRFQIVMSTHSPYLISDLPTQNIMKLISYDDKRSIESAKYGFASNYYDIMSDNFFLDDTIGEFAKQKINGCIQAVNCISDDLDKLANDELILDDGLPLFIEDSLKIIEEQNKIIDLVGDKFIKKQLQQLSDSVKQRLLVHSDDSVRKQQLEQDIAELEERIRQKKMELTND